MTTIQIKNEAPTEPFKQSIVLHYDLERFAYRTTDKVSCPNGCGDLVIPRKKPWMFPIQPSVLEKIEESDLNNLPEWRYRYLQAMCPHCGFIVTSGEEYALDEVEERMMAFNGREYQEGI